MSEQGWQKFLAAEGVDDWVVLHGGATAVFRVPSLEEAARLADEGHVHGAIEAAARILGEDPMNAAARFVRGAAELAAGDAPAASTSLRAALYADPTFALAAFVLGRAHEALGERAAARRAYEQALRTFDPDDARYAWMLGHLEISELAVVCRTRLRALS